MKTVGAVIPGSYGVIVKWKAGAKPEEVKAAGEYIQKMMKLLNEEGAGEEIPPCIQSLTIDRS